MSIFLILCIGGFLALFSSYGALVSRASEFKSQGQGSSTRVAVGEKLGDKAAWTALAASVLAVIGSALSVPEESPSWLAGAVLTTFFTLWGAACIHVVILIKKYS